MEDRKLKTILGLPYRIWGVKYQIAVIVELFGELRVKLQGLNDLNTVDAFAFRRKAKYYCGAVANVLKCTATKKTSN
jgi:hypothetical protein